VARRTWLLTTSPTFRRYWLGRLGSYAGDQVARTALVIAVFQLHGARALGWLLLASTAPRLLGPVLGVLADRFDQRRLMVGCDTAQAAVYLLLAGLAPSLPAILVLTAAGTTLATVFSPAGRCLVPRMVGMDRLAAANAQLAVAVNTGIAAGPALGGLLFATAGLRATLVVNAATFVLSAVLLAAPGFRFAAPQAPSAAGDAPGVPAGSGLAPAAVPPGSGVVAQAAPVPDASVLDDLRAGLGVVWSTPVVRAVSFTLLVSVVFAALDNVAVVPFGLNVLQVGDGTVGLLGTAYGLGMVLAPMLLVMRRREYRSERVLLYGLLGLGAGTVVTGGLPVLGLALAGQALAGAGNGWQNVATDTLIQRAAPAQRLGAVFGTVYTAPYAAEIVAYAAGGPLLAMTDPRWLLVASGVGVLGTLAVGYPALVRALNRPPRTEVVPQAT
jgi:MFS family permease